MASDPDFVRYVCDQMSDAGEITSRKMFGEYAVYCDAKVVALICDNQCFVKPLDVARRLLATPYEAAPYPGAKPHLVIDTLLDDRQALGQLIRIVAANLPPPKPKRPREKKPASAGAND